MQETTIRQDAFSACIRPAFLLELLESASGIAFLSTAMVAHDTEGPKPSGAWYALFYPIIGFAVVGLQAALLPKPSGSVAFAENSTKTEAASHLQLNAATLPN